MFSFSKNIQILFLLFVFLSFNNPSHSMEEKEKDSPSSVVHRRNVSEAFLLGDISSLQDTGKKVHSNILDADAELYKCDEKSFAQLFPVSPFPQSRELSFAVGQITNKDDFGIGTGTLVKISTSEDKIRVLGVTAAHNFLRFDKKQGVTWPEKFFGRQFVLGSMTHPQHNDQYFTIGRVLVDKVMVQAIPKKDICLFEGEITCNPDVFENNSQFIEKFQSFPKILQANIKKEQKDSIMYHYPLGVKNQRRSKGRALETGQHEIRSLFGSSGACLFTSEGEIFGIHTGVKYEDLVTDKIAEYNGESDIPIARYNSFELFSQSEYNELISGVDLYNGQHHDLSFMLQLSKLAETVTNGN